MEFLEEETRPRFLFQSRRASSSTSPPQPINPNNKFNKPLTLTIILCASLSISLILISVFFLQSQTLKSILLWFSLSFLAGPFAPLSLTAGDIRVGHGELLRPPPPPPHLQQSADDEPKKRRHRTRKPDDPDSSDLLGVNVNVNANGSVHNNMKKSGGGENFVCNGDDDGSVEFEEKEWSDEDFDLLKKQMLKHPVGESGRWELIAEAFRGRHKVDSVIKMGKSMVEKRPGNGGDDSFSRFLKQRKPLDGRLVEEGGGGDEVLGDGNEGKKESGNWSSGEDIALLNGLKAFPKDVSMRWEKITAAVPGKSKAACMKRIGELKRDFRSSKASTDS